MTIDSHNFERMGILLLVRRSWRYFERSTDDREGLVWQTHKSRTPGFTREDGWRGIEEFIWPRFWCWDHSCFRFTQQPLEPRGGEDTASFDARSAAALRERAGSARVGPQRSGAYLEGSDMNTHPGGSAGEA